MHLTLIFLDNYPLSPPVVSVQSTADYPFISRGKICVDILESAKQQAWSYTPAYTLKGICIQLLSMFSDLIDQDCHSNIIPES